MSTIKVGGGSSDVYSAGYLIANETNTATTNAATTSAALKSLPTSAAYIAATPAQQYAMITAANEQYTNAISQVNSITATDSNTAATLDSLNQSRSDAYQQLANARTSGDPDALLQAQTNYSAASSNYVTAFTAAQSNGGVIPGVPPADDGVTVTTSPTTNTTPVTSTPQAAATTASSTTNTEIIVQANDPRLQADDGSTAYKNADGTYTLDQVTPNVLPSTSTSAGIGLDTDGTTGLTSTSSTSNPTLGSASVNLDTDGTTSSTTPAVSSPTYVAPDDGAFSITNNVSPTPSTANAPAAVSSPSNIVVANNPANTTPIKVADRRVRLTPKNMAILGSSGSVGLGNLAGGLSSTISQINSLAQKVGADTSAVNSALSQAGALSGNSSAGSSLLSPLIATNGLMFPYTPTIQYSGAANYSTMETVHSNQDFRMYKNTPSQQFSIVGAFTAQSTGEGLYMLAALHFLRVVTKMRFGTGTQLGLPPPVLILNGYGIAMLNNLSVIITGFQMDLPENVDYIQVNTVAGIAWVPVKTSISVSCVVQNTPNKLRTFNWDNFASGQLMSQGGWA